jgi:predicted dehydrogenase
MKSAIGIIGAGSIVEQYYISTLKNIGFKNIIIADSDLNRAKYISQKFGVVYKPTNELLEFCDTIIIATPPHSHFQNISDSVQKGKTIICEKPFVAHKKDAIELIDKCDANDALLLVAHMRRVYPAIEVAKDYISQQEFGPLIKAEIIEGARFSYQSQSGYVTNNFYGGVLLDTGSHAIDCFLYITGMDTMDANITVQSVTKDKNEPAHEIDALFYLNDIDVHLKLSRYESLANKITLHYEKAIVEIPLFIYPQISVTQNGIISFIKKENGCLSYISQAFTKELSMMLLDKNIEPFKANRFVTLTQILETLHQA